MMDSTGAALDHISVGPSGADVNGSDGRAIQTALDALAYSGGGTVTVLPGEYVLADSVRLRSNVRLIGSGSDTVLRREPMVWSPLAVDADIGQKEITPADASRFRPGMGVCLRDDAKPTAMSNRPLTVTAIESGRLLTGDYVTVDYSAERNGLVVNHFPLIHGWEVENAVVQDMVLDSQADDRTAIALLRSSALYLERCSHCHIRDVALLNCEGDGLCTFTCDHVVIEGCQAGRNIEYGIHLGSHSPFCEVLNCHVHHNGADGIYLCWGVREGRIAENTIHHNGHIKGRHGISIGHKDTDNLVVGNHIHENVRHGIYFRQKTEANGAHRNAFRENLIEDNGTPPAGGCGVYVSGATHDLLFENNVVRESHEGDARTQRHAFVLAKGVSRVRIVGNEIWGHPEAAIVDESGSPDNELQSPDTAPAQPAT